MDKKRLREEAKKMLHQIPESEKQQIEKKIATHLFSSSWWKNSHTIGITVSTSYEWDTEKIILQGWKEGKKIVVPKCEPSVFALRFHHLQHFSQLECVYQNLWEPIAAKTKQIEKSQIDLIIVPGLLFDIKGFRLGYGGGYYDRFLAGFSNETLAVTSRKQVVESLPADEYDLPVNHIITEEGILL